MTHDAAHFTAVLLAGAAVSTAAASPQVPLTETQILIISMSFGAMGGVLATLMSDELITVRGMLMRAFASIMAAPGIVWLLLLHYNPEPTILAIFAVSGFSGLAAWPIASAIPNIAPSKLKELLGGPK